MTDQPQESEDRHVRPFAEFLQRQSRGATHRELSDGLHQLVAKVQTVRTSLSDDWTILNGPVS